MPDGFESHGHPRGGQQAAAEQRRAKEQDERQGDFRGDQRVAQPGSSRRRRTGAQRRRGVAALGFADRGDEPEPNRGDD